MVAQGGGGGEWTNSKNGQALTQQVLVMDLAEGGARH